VFSTLHGSSLIGTVNVFLKGIEKFMSDQITVSCPPTWHWSENCFGIFEPILFHQFKQDSMSYFVTYIMDITWP